MTTIATDGRTIAADGRTAIGWMVSGTSERKIVVGVNEDGLPALFAVAGVMTMIGPLMKWVAGGREGEPPKCTGGDDPWTMLIIDASGIRRIDAGAPYPYFVPAPAAIGSGRDFAITALDLGKSPREAVEMACKRDVWSGGEILVIDIAEALQQRSALLSVAA